MRPVSPPGHTAQVLISHRQLRSSQWSSTPAARKIGRGSDGRSVGRPMPGRGRGATLVARLGNRPGAQEVRMAKFMDVHSGFFGVSQEQLAEAHGRDLAIESEEGVHYEQAWLDPVAGKVFCLVTGPSKE